MSQYFSQAARRGALAISTILGLGLLTAPVAFGGGAAVPDVMDLPAAANPRATHMLQLGLARAGTRLVSVGEGGVVLLSDDDGHNWRQAGAVPVSVTLTDVDFADARNGWAVGHGGIVLHSADGGETWQRQMDGVTAAQLVAAEAKAMADTGAPGADAAVRNGEYMIADGPDKPFLDVRFVDAAHGWVVGAYGLALATADGGATWTSITAHIGNRGGKHLYRIEPLGTGLFIAGEQGALFHAADREGAFTPIDSGYEGTFFGFLPLLDGGVLAYGLKGNVWRAGPGLDGWHRIELGQDVTITAGLTLADGSLLLGDEGGRLMHSTDGGRSFKTAEISGSTGLTALAEAADGAIVAASPRGNARLAEAGAAKETN